jgi:hypothetical protein
MVGPSELHDSVIQLTAGRALDPSFREIAIGRSESSTLNPLISAWSRLTTP